MLARRLRKHASMKLSLLFGAAFLVACGSSPKPNPAVAAFARAAQAPAPSSELALASGSELRVRLDQDLGPGVSPDGKRFTARLASPLLDRRGIVLVPAGSLIHGHVVHVDETQQRVELAFDRLETREGVYMLKVTVIAATPYALTVAPQGAPTSETVVLQSVGPNAIGGGPIAPESEAEEDAPRGTPIVPFDAELRLKLLGPVVRLEQ